jgi:hypothetical protein
MFKQRFSEIRAAVFAHCWNGEDKMMRFGMGRRSLIMCFNWLFDNETFGRAALPHNFSWDYFGKGQGRNSGRFNLFKSKNRNIDIGC